MTVITSIEFDILVKEVISEIIVRTKALYREQSVRYKIKPYCSIDDLCQDDDLHESIKNTLLCRYEIQDMQINRKNQSR